MAGLTRRRFLRTVAAAAAATGLETTVLGPPLSHVADAQGRAPARAPATWADPAIAVPPPDGSTLVATIRQRTSGVRNYRTLVTGAGEPHIPRLDVLGRAAGADRVGSRRSLLYFGHLSDLHVIDAQSPGRIEPMIDLDHAAFGSAFHPQDPLSVHVTAAMVRSFALNRTSAVTGAPLGAAVVTGDSADMHSDLELRWYIDLLDGVTVNPASGSGTRFEGVQAWPEASWAYRPADPAGGAYGDWGFPRLPDLLPDSIARPVASVGLPVPWYAVYGNHDTLLLGAFGINSQMRALAVGGRKASTAAATTSAVLGGYAASASVLQRAVDAAGLRYGHRAGLRSVTPDARRFLFSQRDFMAEHFRTAATPGPIGHGFTRANLDTGRTWWAADLSPHVRALGLDTCNQTAGPDGAVPDDQFQWLRAQLADAQAQRRLCLILSHHNSLTLENRAVRPGFDQKLHGAEELIGLLLQYPVAVGWLNGHTHLNQILAHGRDGRGFWEITTASCIDFPQQQQVIELVDNRDGTLSLFTTVLDHASPVEPSTGGGYLDLASRSRELASNDWTMNPLARLGSELDRNTELLLPAPFDLSTISDADVAHQHLIETARLTAFAAKRLR